MLVPTHPKELSREAVEKWLKGFKMKLKRTTNRDALDRLILSVERNITANWKEVIFQNGKVKVSAGWWEAEERALTSFQKTILAKNPDLEG